MPLSGTQELPWAPSVPAAGPRTQETLQLGQVLRRALPQDALKRAAAESGQRHLLIVTQQPFSEELQSLRTKRRVALDNPMSIVVWTGEQEKRLKEVIKNCSVGKACLTII